VIHTIVPGSGCVMFIEGASAPAADPFMVVSPPRPGLLSRLRGLLRRGQ
jgi:hypothetical protein